jgi:GNAT superfamily N-acetyltransferase
MTTSEPHLIFSDLALSRRLERAEARSNAEFVDTRAELFPEIGAEWIEVAGAYAMFDGVESPVTQTFGLGLFDPITPFEMERLEDFFLRRHAPVCHEVSPLADPSLLRLLVERGYQPIELTSVMYRPLGDGLQLPPSRNEKVRARLTQAGEEEMWAQTSARGWSEFSEFADLFLDLSAVVAKKRDGLSFLAELDGRPIATGAMFIHDRVSLLAGASTIPEGRKQGAQLALLEGRLRYASERGCDIAMIGALPGSASQRNAERQGFRIAYTRIKWRLNK